MITRFFSLCLFLPFPQQTSQHFQDCSLGNEGNKQDSCGIFRMNVALPSNYLPSDLKPIAHVPGKWQTLCLDSTLLENCSLGNERNKAGRVSDTCL